MPTDKPQVAIVGAGPAGLAGARFLQAHGFDPVLFEAAEGLGGQWRCDNPLSGVWPDMHTNTSRVVTRFSDLDFPSGARMFPHNRQVLAYLDRYARTFGLHDKIRVSTPVRRIERAPSGGWSVHWTEPGGADRSQTFARVVLASGRFNVPFRPDVPGLDGFTGARGVVHTFDYKQPDRYRGQRVLVAGAAISALEVASDLAMLGAARVVVCSRRQRYVMPKVIAGVPADSRFSRYGAWAAATLPAQINDARLKAWLLAVGGDPSRYGACAPAEDVRQARAALSQYFLPLVAEGRIVTRPWMAEVAGQTVRFTDGSEEDFDAVILGTGFRLDPPCLAPDIREVLRLDGEHMDLSDFTFHPDLEGLAFLGFIAQTGPYFPVIELQARYLAHVWGGVVPAPTRDALQAGVEAYRASFGGPPLRSMHAVALQFARLAGVEPDVAAWPALARALLFGPLSATSFRLSGPDSLPDAPEQILKDAVLHGTAPTSGVLAPGTRPDRRTGRDQRRSGREGLGPPRGGVRELGPQRPARGQGVFDPGPDGDRRRQPQQAERARADLRGQFRAARQAPLRPAGYEQHQAQRHELKGGLPFGQKGDGQGDPARRQGLAKRADGELTHQDQPARQGRARAARSHEADDGDRDQGLVGDGVEDGARACSGRSAAAPASRRRSPSPPRPRSR